MALADLKEKVEEALAQVEGACRDREEALERERAAVEEARRLQAELRRLMDETERRVVEEGEQLRRSYDSRLALVEQDRDRKALQAEQLQKECERLQGLLTQRQLFGSEKALQAEQLQKECERLQGLLTQRQLSRSEDKSTACESNFERLTLATLEARKRKMRQKGVDKLMKDTRIYQQELAMSEQETDLLSNQLLSTSLDLAQLQNTGSATAVEPAVSLSSTLALYKRLNESYGKMNEKWKNDVFPALADRFEEKLKQVKMNARRRSPDKGSAGAKNIGL